MINHIVSIPGYIQLYRSLLRFYYGSENDIKEMLYHTSLNDRQAIRDIVRQTKTSLEQAFIIISTDDILNICLLDLFNRDD